MKCDLFLSLSVSIGVHLWLNFSANRAPGEEGRREKEKGRNGEEGNRAGAVLGELSGGGGSGGGAAFGAAGEFFAIRLRRGAEIVAAGFAAVGAGELAEARAAAEEEG